MSPIPSKAATVDRAFIHPQTLGIEWHGPRQLGLHLTVVAYSSDTVVVHNRGYGVRDTTGRIYVPASYHVFDVLDRAPDGLHHLEHRTSFPVRLEQRGPTGATKLATRPYPGPTRTSRNGHARESDAGSTHDVEPGEG